MSAHELAAQRHQQLRQASRAVEDESVRLWRQAETSNLAPSWAASTGRVAAAVTAAQLAMASGADAYTDAVLGRLNVDATAAGRVIPSSLAGTGADGRSLVALLFSPVVSARTALGRGASFDEAMLTGQATLQMLIRTEVADAGRVADGIAIAARSTVGYVRMVSPPSCSRCAILAGKFYRWNAGFDRHPACQCVHVPAPESVAGDLRTDPSQLFDEGQVTRVSKADAKAIADGADPSRVINAHRGMGVAGGRKTTTSMAGRQGIPSTRLRPEQIYRDATSRDDAVRLLRLHGYIR